MKDTIIFLQEFVTKKDNFKNKEIEYHKDVILGRSVMELAQAIVSLLLIL
jgi:hypothetical protein